MKLVIKWPTGNEIVDLPDNAMTLAFWMRDTFSINDYQSLIDQHGLPEILISEAHPKYIELAYNQQQYYYCPKFLNKKSTELATNAIVNDYIPEYCFNFMINKKQINRYLLLKLVEWFNLSSYQYTWSGIGATFDMSQVLGDFNLLDKNVNVEKFRTHMLNPVSKILPYFIDTSLNVNDNIQTYTTSVVNYGSNLWVWNNVTSAIFSKSAVSLISESIAYEKIINFTEKTLYSILGLTFPIWVGGYGQSDLWKQHGFDTFDDVINHDYQYHDTLLERCYYAIHDNLQILTDLNYAKFKKQQNIERLKQNRKLLAPNIQNTYDSLLLKLPETFKTSMAQSYTKFFK
jgi:hypothetical protein